MNLFGTADGAAGVLFFRDFISAIVTVVSRRERGDF